MTGDFATSLVTGLRSFDLSLAPEAIARLALYFDELLKWSRKVNLIAKGTDHQQIIENHFIDSLTILPLLQNGTCHLLDIGSGAGFPGLVCKAAWPELAVSLVEPRVKRVSFLGHIVRTLGLSGVSILSCRIEDTEQLPSERVFSHITSRAVNEIGPFLQMAARFAPTGPRIICMKGRKWREELDIAGEMINASPFQLDRVIELVLPFSGAQRCLVVFEPRTLTTLMNKLR